MPEQPDEKNTDKQPAEKEQAQETETKENEPPATARKQKVVNLPRSDSIGSGSGKFRLLKTK